MNKEEAINFIKSTTATPKQMRKARRDSERRIAETRFWFRLMEMEFERYKKKVKSQQQGAE